MVKTQGSVNVEALVITGTGMPSLQTVVDLQSKFGIPVFNSNIALAWPCLRAAETGFPLLGGWTGQLSRL
jgi:maleate cis-trans isomerase